MPSLLDQLTILGLIDGLMMSELENFAYLAMVLGTVVYIYWT